MFYNSNLRQQLVSPQFEPEYNQESDIQKYGMQQIFTRIPTEYLGIEWWRIKEGYPQIFKKVKSVMVQVKMEGPFFDTRYMNYVTPL